MENLPKFTYFELFWIKIIGSFLQLMTNTFGRKAVNFYLNLSEPENLPDHIKVVNPYQSSEVKRITEMFFTKYFNDSYPRYFIFGINPGRFGGGITGINFTDPVALKNYCGISNNLGEKRELSSQFVYEFINEFGGPEFFYKNFFLSALYPLAILKGGKNYNFYDDRKVYKLLKPEIISNVKEQIKFGARNEHVISLGKKNLLFLKSINDEIKFFYKIEFLEHPRFIMQYKRKKLNDYIKKYSDLLGGLISKPK